MRALRRLVPTLSGPPDQGSKNGNPASALIHTHTTHAHAPSPSSNSSPNPRGQVGRLHSLTGGLVEARLKEASAGAPSPSRDLLDMLIALSPKDSTSTSTATSTSTCLSARGLLDQLVTLVGTRRLLCAIARLDSPPP